MMQPPSLSQSGETPTFSLTGLAESANEKLEAAVNEATHRAFNLGCLIGLLPAVIFAAIIFLTSRFSAIGAAMAVALGVISAIAFANLAAMITRNNTARRAYQDRVLPEIQRSLNEAGVTRQDFDLAARENLPASAALYPFVISSITASTSTDPASNGDEPRHG